MSWGVAVAETAQGRLAELYLAHAGAATRLAFLMTGNRDLAEDIAQEAFIKLAARFRDLRNPDAFGAYLRTTVINLTRGHFRRRRVERAYLDRERGLSRRAETIPDVEGRDEMWAALQQLPHRQRAVIVLRYYEDLSERQAADALGCSVGAVKSLTNRAVASLREQMKAATR